MKKKLLIFLSYVLTAALAAGVAFGAAWYYLPDCKLDQLRQVIMTCHPDEQDAVALEDAAAAAMVSAAGDRWSYYIPQSEYDAHLEGTANAYVGIGITIFQTEDGGIEVQVVNEGGSAWEAGILVGDRILAAEGQSTEGMTVTGLRNIVRGEEGTFVEITVLRGGEEITFRVERRLVEVEVATGVMVSENVGLVTIVNFDDRCAQETLLAIENLLDQGAEKLIFDVRDNPGGYAHEMVAVLDYLLPEGELFRTLDYAGRESVDRSDAGCLEIPMAVMVNGNSFSAAEFFAAALQEYEAAVVIGEQTSGKGYFQYTYELEDGSAVALSSGRYFTPQGRCLEEVGVTPDVEVVLDQDTAYALAYGQLEWTEDPQLMAALAALEG